MISSLTGTSTGSLSVAETASPKPGYLKLHANCCEMTSTVSGSSGWAGEAEALENRPFWPSTMALTIAIAVTSTAGTAVHAISRPVCPWIGGPSSSSSGRARKLISA